MKKALLAIAAVLLLSLPLMAGPYFVLENEGLILGPALTIGTDWNGVIGPLGPSLSGDLSVEFANILDQLAIDNTWTGNFNFEIDWGTVLCELDMTAVVDPSLWPNKIEVVEGSSISLKLTGSPGYPVEVWGGASLDYKNGAKWLFVPVFGIEVHLN